MSESTVKSGELGQNVTYVSTKGYEKAAIVVGTPESILDGHNYPTLEEGERHLLVFTLNGASPRLNVKSQDAALAAEPTTDEDGTVEAVGFWR